MPPKDSKSRQKKDHHRGGGGGKFAQSGEEIESRTAKEAARLAQKKAKAGSGSEDESGSDLDSEDDGIAFDRSGEGSTDAAPPPAPSGASAAELAAAAIFAADEEAKLAAKAKADAKAAAKTKAAAGAAGAAEASDGMTRAERGELEAMKKKAAYEAKHAAGLTEELVSLERIVVVCAHSDVASLEVGLLFSFKTRQQNDVRSLFGPPCNPMPCPVCLSHYGFGILISALERALIWPGFFSFAY
jgi:hypothetical protein